MTLLDYNPLALATLAMPLLVVAVFGAAWIATAIQGWLLDRSIRRQWK